MTSADPSLFLPVDKNDMKKRGWDYVDFIFVSGDAYVDHPSFGPAIITRLLEKNGYRVGMIAQPDMNDENSMRVLGQPRLAFLVSSGNMDSMLAKYTAAKKIRRSDAYSPGGRAGLRPERAVTVYSRKIRKIFPDIPVIIGGIEASLRRFAHYDYWSDSVRPSVLAESGADLLIYGMGERQIVEIAAELWRGTDIKNIQDIRGTCYKVPSPDYVYDYISLPSFENIRADKNKFAEAFKTEYLEQDPFRGKRLIQNNGEFFIVQNPPALPLSESEMDEVYDLPYARSYHPRYEKQGGIPAISEVKFSLISHRGCFGGCAFCAITMHQGRIIQRRSHDSLLREAKILMGLSDFKGYIHDVGGPTANFRRTACDEQMKRGSCRGKECLTPVICKNLKADHSDYLSLLEKLRKLPGVKKVFIRSGIRFDYLIHAGDGFLKTLCRYHISGQLKIAPEHISDNVLRLMGKPKKDVFIHFVKKFGEMNKSLNKNQYLVPYFMSGHPGSGLKDALRLALFIKQTGHRPQQVQDFIPTPGTLSTAMYFTGMNPLTKEKVFVPYSSREKKLQRALLQYWLPKNHGFVREALVKLDREDLIGSGRECLVRSD